MVFSTPEAETVTFAPVPFEPDFETDILRAPVVATTPMPLSDLTTTTTPAPTVADFNFQTFPDYKTNNNNNNNNNPFLPSDNSAIQLDTLSSPLPAPTDLPATVTVPFYTDYPADPYPTFVPRRKKPGNPPSRLVPKIVKVPAKGLKVQHLFPTFSFGMFSTPSDSKPASAQSSTRSDVQ
jgi:hypothetical protein